MTPRCLSRILPGALIWGGCAASLANTYHVDGRHPMAADTNPGTAEKPFRTIGAAAERVAAGDRVVIGTGVYRESVKITAGGTAEKPIVFESAPAAHVVVTGADVLSELEREPGSDNVYSVVWPHRFISWNKTHAHPNNDYHLVIGRAEQVLAGGYALRQVLSRDRLSRGTFFADLEAKRLFVWDAANRKLTDSWSSPLIEASTRPLIWQVEGEHVHTRGIRFRYAANQAQHGAVKLKGSHGLLEDCVVERMNTSGASFTGTDITVRRCVFRDNGQLGFSAGGAHRLLFTDCLVENNNTKGFNRGWEAGANKLVLCRGVVLEKSRFVRNRGHGVWFDIGNEECTVRNCLIAENDDSGIFYEISYSLRAHDNVIVGNGFFHNPGAWGANGGISLSSSPDCVIERNILLGNREGLQFREQNRTTPRIGDKRGIPVWNHDNLVRSNVFARNRDLQVGGWFDSKEMHHWPRDKQGEGKGAASKEAAADVATEYKAGDEGRKPPDTTLEGLRLRFEGNLFHREGEQGLLQWGVSWRHHRRWATLEEAQASLGILGGNREAPVPFADPRSLDLRVPAACPAFEMGCYPKGDVTGVVLGALPPAE